MIQMPRLYAERRNIDRAEIIDFLRESLGCESVPASEDSLSFSVFRGLEKKKRDYNSLKEKFKGNAYPGQDSINDSLRALEQILRNGNDNKFLQLVSNNLDVLKNNLEEMKSIGLFYMEFGDLYDNAHAFLETIDDDIIFLEFDMRASKAVDQIKDYLKKPIDNPKITEVRELIKTVKLIHSELLCQKRLDVLSIAEQCMGSIHTKADSVPGAKKFVNRVDSYYAECKKRISSTNCNTIASLVAIEDEMIRFENEWFEKLKKKLEN